MNIFVFNIHFSMMAHIGLFPDIMAISKLTTTIVDCKNIRILDPTEPSSSSQIYPNFSTPALVSYTQYVFIDIFLVNI